MQPRCHKGLCLCLRADPARKGLSAAVVRWLLACGARTIVYVSCHLATQVRRMSLFIGLLNAGVRAATRCAILTCRGRLSRLLAVTYQDSTQRVFASCWLSVDGAWWHILGRTPKQDWPWGPGWPAALCTVVRMT